MPSIIQPDAYRIHTQGIAAVVNAKCEGPSLAQPGTMLFRSVDGGTWSLKVPEEFAGFVQKGEMVVFSLTLIRNTLGEAVPNVD